MTNKKGKIHAISYHKVLLLPSFFLKNLTFYTLGELGRNAIDLVSPKQLSSGG
jgi:hypothetical protein